MRIFITPLLLYLMLLLGVTAQAAEQTYTVPLEESSPTDSDPDDSDIRNKGHRMAPRPIFCVISENEGVTISTISVADINTFELYNPNGVCIGSFPDVDSFVTALFSSNVSTVELRFVTANHIYYGYLTLN